MKVAIIVAIGGAAGALGRYLLTSYLGPLVGGGFPWAILMVNVLGSFFLGAITELAAQSVLVTPEIKTLMTVGFLGAFTTFSAFSLDIVELCERGQWSFALLYICASVLISVFGLIGGVMVVKAIVA
ncbi:MAG: fluoride efflux transporter CrcB [Rhodospirillaceae bacterium]|nr:fluoride efflux transporter CrcB [Rhodospirillaceae bacterium]|tara:strand:+ start:3532 stop:3912 length:381 start_codon:yes stop_codon:yes gene_type:complete